MFTICLFIVIIVVLIGVYFVSKDIKIPNIIVEMPAPENKTSVQEPIINQKIVVEGGDDRYRRAPEPLRNWATRPDLRGALIPQGAVPIFQPALGYPDQFQQMGILTIENSSQILPLFGRRAGNRSDRYNYYTRTDSYNPIQLPISYERRDCMDDIGCGELYGSEIVKIDGMNNFAKVKVYKYDAPRYIPAVL
jgi:hypothetical protein